MRGGKEGKSMQWQGVRNLAGGRAGASFCPPSFLGVGDDEGRRLERVNDSPQGVHDAQHLAAGGQGNERMSAGAKSAPTTQVSHIDNHTQPRIAVG